MILEPATRHPPGLRLGSLGLLRVVLLSLTVFAACRGVSAEVDGRRRLDSSSSIFRRLKKPSRIRRLNSSSSSVELPVDATPKTAAPDEGYLDPNKDHGPTTRIILSTGAGTGTQPPASWLNPLRAAIVRRNNKKKKSSNRITIDFGSQSTSGTTLSYKSSSKNAIGYNNHDVAADITPRQIDDPDEGIKRITYQYDDDRRQMKKYNRFRRYKGSASVSASATDAGTAAATTGALLGDGGEIVVSLDSGGVKKLLTALPSAVSHVVGGLVTTLRVVVLLIVGRRLINGFVYFIKDIVLNLPADYLTGYYLRKTFTRLERAYLRYYELPSALRALARLASQICIQFVFAEVVGWVYGMSEPPCRAEGKGLSLVCGTLWMAIVVVAGRACSKAVAVWGGPLRLEVASHPKNRKVFTRPSHFIEWVTNMDELKSILSHDTVKAFDPNPLIFPATWIPLKILLTFAVAKALSSEPSSSSNADQVPKLMKQYLVQLALGDEWHRVFLVEKRVGLGLLAISLYFLGLVNLFANATAASGVAASLMIPSLVAVIVSGWMNVVIFVTRLNLNKKEAADKALEKRKRAAIGTFRLGDSYYN